MGNRLGRVIGRLRSYDAYERFNLPTEGPTTLVAFAIIPPLFFPLIRPLHGEVATALRSVAQCCVRRRQSGRAS